VVATSARTAAPGFEGSPIEVPGVREMVAISVVGISVGFGVSGCGVGDCARCSCDDGYLVFEVVGRRREMMWYDDQIGVEQ